MTRWCLFLLRVWFVSSCVLVMGWPCKKLFHFTFYILLFLLKRPECLMDSNNILLTWHRQVLSSACTLFRSAFLAVLSNQSLNAWEGECPLRLRKASSELKLTIGGKKYTPMKLLSQSNVINQIEYRASCWKLAPREWKVQMQKKSSSFFRSGREAGFCTHLSRKPRRALMSS